MNEEEQELVTDEKIDVKELTNVCLFLFWFVYKNLENIKDEALTLLLKKSEFYFKAILKIKKET
jgi:hypothetical protein